MSDCTLPNGRAERVLTLADGVAGIITLAGGRAERVLTIADGTTCLPVLPPSGPVLPTWINYAWEADSLTLADGDPVASWVDVVGGVALAQTTPSARPVYRADLGSSGYAGLSFDGTDDYVWSSDAGLTGLFSSATIPEFTVVTVLNGAGTLDRWALSLGSSVSASPVFGLPQSGGAAADKLFMRTNANITRTLTSPVASTSGVRSLSIALNSAGLRYSWDNRTPVLIGADQAAASGYTLNRFALGGLLRATFGSASTQDFHAVYIYGGMATGPQLTELWDYLTQKWGTP
jgi:hypothetical protein